MRLYSWNVNGIRAVINKGVFNEFIAEHQPDILCLQETKAMRGQVEIDLPDYEEFWNSAEKKGYSGTAIFSRIKPINVVNDLLPEVVNQYNLNDKFGDTNKEGRVISAEFEKFWVVSVYTPNSKGDLSRLNLRYNSWDPAFLKHLTLLGKNKPVIFAGDLNVAHQEIDLANPKPNIGKHGFTYEEREGFDKLIKAGFADTFRFLQPNRKDAYTWWTHWANARARNIGWRIDYWLIDQTLSAKLKSAEIHPDVLGSDHCPVSIEIDI